MPWSRMSVLLGRSAQQKNSADAAKSCQEPKTLNQKITVSGTYAASQKAHHSNRSKTSNPSLQLLPQENFSRWSILAWQALPPQKHQNFTLDIRKASRAW